MSNAATIKTIQQANALLGRLADRSRAAGLFLAHFSADGRLLWQDSHMPKLLLLATHEPALGQAVRAASNAPGPWLDAAPAENRKSKIENPPALLPYPGINVRLVPIARRRKVSGWIAVFARVDNLAISEELHRAAGKSGLDVLGLIAQSQRLPIVAPAALPPLAALVGQMHDDMNTAAISQGELAGVAEELSGVYEELSILCKISDGMRFSQKPQPFLETVCQELQAIGNFHAVAIGLVQRSDDSSAPVINDVAMLVGQCAIGGRQLINALHAPIHETLAGGETTVHNDNSGASDFSTLGKSIQRFVCVPLVREKRPLGILLALDKNDGTEFTSVDLTLLNNVGNQCSIFLENASLYQDMQDLFMGVLHALTHSIDAKDAYTRGHSQRVAELSRSLARKIGLSDEQCERIYLSGLLHDIGKIGVPEAVLTKPGRLTDAEFEAIKKHPAIGAQILANIKQLQDIIPGVLYHHERWDSKGYPYNLAAENIPLMGRIICVADSFDAMSSTRTYRPALPLDTVLNEIRRCAGAQFDPALATAFVTLDFEPYKKSIEEHMTFRQLPGAEGAV